MLQHALSLCFAAALLVASPAAAQGSLFDPAALPITTETFALLDNGLSVGTQVVTVERADGGVLFREVNTTSAGTQTTDVVMDRALGMRSVHQEGEMRCQSMRIDVTYAGGRAQGRARVSGPKGTREFDVDAAVPTGVVDDNMLMTMLPALHWSLDGTYEVPVFASGRNDLLPHTFRVTGEEDVTVPAGTLGTYRVEVSAAQPMVLHVSTAAPHRLIRLQVVGTPIDVVRTGPRAR